MPLWLDPGTGWMQAPLHRIDTAADAYLCCPGPSLAFVDRDLRGPGRVIVAMNTAYPRIRPDLWIGTDRVACFDRRLWHEPFPKICRYIDGDNSRMRHQPQVYFADVEDAAPAQMFLRRHPDCKFVWPHNTFIFALHFLLWSGYKRVHFVGCDMGGDRDYHDTRQLTAELREENRRLYRRQTDDLRQLAPIAARHGVAWISCTPDSPLNEFLPFFDLRDAVARSERHLPESGVILPSQEADAAVRGERQ